jgi:hypothetical protein
MAAPAQVTIEITTSSAAMPDWQNLPAPQPPTITVNGTSIPEPSNAPAWLPNGCQVVVFSSYEDLTQPASIISNEYQLVANQQGSWGESYRWMWDDVATQIMSSGNVEDQIVIIATFGLDVQMTPTAATFELALGRGAGVDLQQWGLLPSISEGGYYIQYPANYILLGNTGYDYDEGYEQFAYASQYDQTLSTSLTETIDNPGA